MSLLLFLIISYILLSISLYFLFPKMGEEGWKGLVPGLNFVVWSEKVGRKRFYAAWLLFPIVNIFIFAGMAVDLVRSFHKLDFKHSAMAVIYAPAYFLRLAFDKKAEYKGPILEIEEEYTTRMAALVEKGDKYAIEKAQRNNPYKKSGMREWVESVVFAVFAAALIRMFLIEAFVIPTPSMEGSLLVGDFLFVSKAHYGIRTPMTTTMVPLLHNRLPFFNKESYLNTFTLPYYRLPAIQDVARNQPFVFNWPVGDSVYLTPSRSWAVGQVQRDPGLAARDPYLKRLIQKKDVIVRPIDKKDHYIKRCVAIPGDTLQIKDRQIYINGEKGTNPSHMQFLYQAIGGRQQLNLKKLDEWGVNIQEGNAQNGIFFLNGEQAQKIRDIGVELDFYPMPSRDLFPHDQRNFPGWTNDNFGPVWIPKKGVTIDISPNNIALYRRVINVYENHDLKIANGKIMIDGVETYKYTFAQDYFWAMGDNRHNSEDSRAWGFVPHDHVVGKPLFIWFSTKNGSMANGINWSRIFTSANKD